MSHNATLRLTTCIQQFQYQAAANRSFTTRGLRKREAAIRRGLAAESSLPATARRPEYDEIFDALLPPPILKKFTEIELPPIKQEAYPDQEVSTTSPFNPPTPTERQSARRTFNELEIPPLPTNVDRRGVRALPRLDTYRDKTPVLVLPRMSIRRHIERLVWDSEFIYGTSVVEAAIRSHRRKIYRLFVYTGGKRTKDCKIRDEAMETLLREQHPDVKIVHEMDHGNMDSMSDSRPHK